MCDHNSFKMVAVYSRLRTTPLTEGQVSDHAWSYQLPAAVFNEIRAQLLIDLGKEAMEALRSSQETLKDFAFSLHERGLQEHRSHYPLLPGKVFRPQGW